MSTATFPKPPAPLRQETDDDNRAEIDRIIDPDEGRIRKLATGGPAILAGDIEQTMARAVILYEAIVNAVMRSKVKADLVAHAGKLRTAAQASASSTGARYQVPAYDPTRRYEARNSRAALLNEGGDGGAGAEKHRDAIRELTVEILLGDLTGLLEPLP